MSPGEFAALVGQVLTEYQTIIREIPVVQEIIKEVEAAAAAIFRQ